MRLSTGIQFSGGEFSDRAVTRWSYNTVGMRADTWQTERLMFRQSFWLPGDEPRYWGKTTL